VLTNSKSHAIINSEIKKGSKYYETLHGRT
jgi:hypothetical protein